MRKALDAKELENVAGGQVYINEKYMEVNFSSISKTFDLKCDYKQARNLYQDLLDENPTMADADFDALVKGQFEANGYI